jgi:hypothetical protein
MLTGLSQLLVTDPSRFEDDDDDNKENGTSNGHLPHPQ